jgi:tRNA threonylcarbamoyladenosine modification (KEOPS) complex  Pcc1 subunit
MKTLRKQRGIGMLGLITIGIMVGFFAMSAIRIAPGYLEYRMVRDVVSKIAEDFDQEEDTIADIRRALSTELNTNQIKSIKYSEVDIARKDGRIVINANYEDRIPLVWRIDAVVKYDDLEFIAGERYSD